ncbi:hydroxycarboxylic acid receptor 2-like [Protopterus annectens]|uniref:hydroxycarboxylic acid receptor 2-like n=1 Tax=Protopterus annectens TaxID=7888 RepID=UPI001CFB5369|nr:hydroxycarboxylic acid receptor 2-like [Protopterus annectens]
MGSSSDSEPCLFPADILKSLLPPILLVEFVFGLLGNGMALWVFCFHMKSWKPSTILLANLAVADFLLIICLPFRTEYYLREKNWVHGDPSCRIILFMLAMNRVGSIVFLTAVALDRYFRVVHPHHRINSLSNRMAVLVAASMWVLSVAVTAKLLTETHLYNSTKTASNMASWHCDSFGIYPKNKWGEWQDSLFIAEFCLALCIIFYCTYQIIYQLKRRQLNRENKIRKAVKFIFAVAVVFLLSFLPSVASRIHVRVLLLSHNECNDFEKVDRMFYITVCLTYFNSALDPLVYYFSSPTFKQFYKNIIHFQKPQPANSSNSAGRDLSIDIDASRTQSVVYL